MDFWSAVSGLEQALWDLAGKRLGVPVVSLLGGPCRERIRVYANGWYSGARTPDATRRRRRRRWRAASARSSSIPFPGRGARTSPREAEQQVVETVRAVRDAVWAEGRSADRGPSAAGAHARRAGGAVAGALRAVLVRGAGVGPGHQRPRRVPARHPTADRHRRGALHQVPSSARCSSAAPRTSSTPTSATSVASRSSARSRRWPKAYHVVVLAAQLQQHYRRARRDAARVGGDPEFP